MKLGRGRPKKKEANRTLMTIRLNADHVDKLNYLSRETGVSKSDILRKGIDMQYRYYTLTH